MSYFKNIFTTGAISKTPARVLKRIASEVLRSNQTLIIELGAMWGENWSDEYSFNNKLRISPQDKACK